MDPSEPDAAPARTVQEWLDRFAAAVRARDYAAARTLFDARVVSFGTVAVRVVGVERLIEEQWRRVWEMTEGFHFHGDGLVVQTDGDLGFAAAEWSSTGLRERSSHDIAGDRRGMHTRRGRATIVLHRTDGRWLAVHTHFSLVPPPWPN